MCPPELLSCLNFLSQLLYLSGLFNLMGLLPSLPCICRRCGACSTHPADGPGLCPKCEAIKMSTLNHRTRDCALAQQRIIQATSTSLSQSNDSYSSHLAGLSLMEPGIRHYPPMIYPARPCASSTRSKERLPGIREVPALLYGLECNPDDRVEYNRRLLSPRRNQEAQSSSETTLVPLRISQYNQMQESHAAGERPMPFSPQYYRTTIRRRWDRLHKACHSTFN